MPLRGSYVIAQELIGKLLGSRNWGLIWKEDMVQRGAAHKLYWLGPEQGCGKRNSFTAGDHPGASRSGEHYPEECYGLSVSAPLKGMLMSLLPNMRALGLGAYGRDLNHESGSLRDVSSTL